MRTILTLSFLAMLLCVSIGVADLREPRRFHPEDPEKIVPMSTRSYPGAFKAFEPATVQVSGKGRSSLGIYVFDAHGSCVALDDDSKLRPQLCDEVAVEWISDGVGRYSVEIRNAGLESNTFALAIP